MHYIATEREGGAGPAFYVDDLIKSNYENSPQIQQHYYRTDYVRATHDAIRSDFRVEGFLFVQGQVVGAYIASPAIDLHYGEVAYPVAEFLLPEYRKDQRVLRLFSLMREEVIRALGAEKFITVRHTGPESQTIRLRYV